MLMKKNVFFLCIFSLTIIACNSSSDESTKAATDTTGDINDNTSIKVDTTPGALSPYDLTADEIKDDAVFADGSQPTSWASAGIDDPVAFKKSLKRLQVAIANNQKDSVAASIAFPLRSPKVKSKEDFLKKYDEYISEKVKKAFKDINFR
jgi:hypothetical protein